MHTYRISVLSFVACLSVASFAAADPLQAPFEGEMSETELTFVETTLPPKVTPDDVQPAGIAQAWRSSPLLEKNMATVNPFNSTNSIAIIGRPSWDSLLDSAVDFSNKEGTLSFTLSPALLFTPYPDWYLANAKITGSANTDDGTVTVGGKYDLDFTDPRFYFQARVRERVGAELDRQYSECNQKYDDTIRTLAIKKRGPKGNKKPLTPAELDEMAQARDQWHATIDKKAVCFNAVLKAVVDDELKRKEEEDKFAPSFSLAGSVNYNSKEGSFGGANASLAAGWKLREPFGIAGSVIPLTANLSYEDAIKKTDKDSDDTERDQQAGGGVEIAYRHEFQAFGADRALELGGAFTALACLDTPCANTKSTLRLNPFLAIAITDSIGGRVDVVWEGNGDDFGSAVAGMSMSYSFSKLGGGS